MIDLKLSDLIEAHEEEITAQPIPVPPDLRLSKVRHRKNADDAARKTKPGKTESP